MIRSNPKHPRVAVIGAGPGGLATAVLLASRGIDVTVYEMQSRVGGRTRRLSAGPYHFDLGPTFFLMPHVLQEIFGAAGRNLDDYVKLDRLDPMYRLVIGDDHGGPDLTLDATQDLSAMRKRIAAIHPPDGEAFARFVEMNRAKLDASEPILRRPIQSPLDLLRLDALKALPHIRPHQSVQQLNNAYFRHPAIQRAVGFQSKYLGMSPFDCPSLFTILPFIEYEYGIWHPRGGCNALMSALAKLLGELGGKIFCDTPVESLQFSGRRVTGVVLGGKGNGESHRYDQVVINSDATWAMKKFFPESMRRRQSNQQIDGRHYSCSTYMLYLGVEGAVDLPHHTIRIAPAYEQNLRDIAEGRLTDDPSFYLCNPSPLDPTLAPGGHSSLYLLLPTPNNKAGIDWRSESPMLRERLLGRVREVLGLSLHDRIRQEIAITPADWQSQHINHGATFNLAHGLDQMLHRRPRHRVPFAEGAYMVGGGTHPGSGLPVIFLSAQITANLMLKALERPAEDLLPRRLNAQNPYTQGSTGTNGSAQSHTSLPADTRHAKHMATPNHG